MLAFLPDAQRLGMRVARTWAFNDGMPRAPGVYDEDQFEVRTVPVLFVCLHSALVLGLVPMWGECLWLLFVGRLWVGGLQEPRKSVL